MPPRPRFVVRNDDGRDGDDYAAVIRDEPRCRPRLSEGITTTKASTSRVQIILLILAQQKHMLPLLLTRLPKAVSP